ncbi:Proteophosphoglycan ppg4 [Rhodotorula diobovata]|uniref:Proteophosphoglycan ppg4 n=1 Tax=Rhodotorula diobovata TaxID=5288 RepID=A0A5C5FPI6_9BASI|nr:Proteophosphoglycan ppg4 [Rhodotorula diobovata]
MPTRPPTGPLAPSRTSTPTLLDLDHAPLRLAPSPSPGLSSSASLLGLAATPSCPPSPSSRSNLRRRRSVSPLPSSADAHHPPPSASTSCSSRPPSPPHSPHRHLHRVDSDVTRPSLRRVTNDALGVAALGTSGGGPPVDPADPDGYGLRRDSKGKGRALDYGGAGGRRAVSENGAANKEREVIVHKVQKTDSYASISLQYGITPQALRSSNRLWPSDPIYLRSTLLIPLDQCNLPSSSFGVERIAREENGDLTVWERNGTGSADRNAAATGLSGAAARRERDGGLVSPQARRVAGASTASALERGAHAHAHAHALGAPVDLLGLGDAAAPEDESENEYHSVWSDGGTPSARDSLDVPRPVGGSYFDGHGPGHLPVVEDLLGSSRGASPSTTAAGSASAVSPAASSSSRATSPPSTSTAAHPSSPSADHEPSSSSPPLAKRTLRVARLPASQLAFFPPASSSAQHSPTKPTHGAQAPRARPGPGPAQRPEDESLFFGPLTNSLSASLSSLGLDRYLPSALSSSSSTSRLHTKGRIALPPSPALAPGPPRSKSRWALLDFGVEEDEAAGAGTGAGAGARGGVGPATGTKRGPAGPTREDYLALATGPPPPPSAAPASGGGALGAGLGLGLAHAHGAADGSAGPRRSSAGGGVGVGVGLEDAGSWAARRPGVSDTRGTSPRQPHPGHKKARDSNEGLGGAQAGAARADVRDVFGLR